RRRAGPRHASPPGGLQRRRAGVPRGRPDDELTESFGRLRLSTRGPRGRVMRLRARHYATAEVVDIVCDEGSIRKVGPPGSERPDVEAGWVAPALFDLQINGCDGRSFNSDRLGIDDVRHVVHACRDHGIAGFFPTLVTNGFDSLRHGLSTLHCACEDDSEVAAAVPGIHLEGPYISPEDGPRGAHPRQHVRPPDWDEFRRLQDAAGGRIRLVTLAPEHDGALEFIEWLVASNVVVA